MDRVRYSDDISFVGRVDADAIRSSHSGTPLSDRWTMAYRFPFAPFPDGWYFVCYSHELPRGKLFNKTFMGREIIAFRGADGGACVADAFCPHLGAHLAKGGGCI